MLNRFADAGAIVVLAMLVFLMPLLHDRYDRSDAEAALDVLGLSDMDRVYIDSGVPLYESGTRMSLTAIGVESDINEAECENDEPIVRSGYLTSRYDADGGHLLQRRLFGEPLDVRVSGAWELYEYDYDIAIMQVNGLRDLAISPLEAYYNADCELAEGAVLLHDGGTVYGPYAVAEIGKYAVCICGDGLSGCACDIYSAAGEGDYSYEEISHEDNLILLTLEVTCELPDIEVRIYDVGGKDAKVRHILFERRP